MVTTSIIQIGGRTSQLVILKERQLRWNQAEDGAALRTQQNIESFAKDSSIGGMKKVFMILEESLWTAARIGIILGINTRNTAFTRRIMKELGRKRRIIARYFLRSMSFQNVKIVKNIKFYSRGWPDCILFVDFISDAFRHVDIFKLVET